MSKNIEIVSCGKGITLEVDKARFNADVVEYLVSIGLRNVLRDVHAGVKSEDEARARSEAKLQAMYDGVTHRAGGSNGLATKVAEQAAEIEALKAQLAKAKSTKK